MHEVLEKETEEKRALFDPTKPDPFSMTKKEEAMRRTGNMSRSQLLPSDAKLTFKADVDSRKSLLNF